MSTMDDEAVGPRTTGPGILVSSWPETRAPTELIAMLGAEWLRRYFDPELSRESLGNTNDAEILRAQGRQHR